MPGLDPGIHAFESASQERRGWPGRSLAMTTKELPRAERRGPEQRFLRRGLRAPILRRRFDLAAEFGGGVPAPARVVEHGARQRDHVGLARYDDVFRLFRLGDQADRDGVDAGRLPDGLRERHLIAGLKR